jgi:hypothetical protein
MLVLVLQLEKKKREKKRESGERGGAVGAW